MTDHTTSIEQGFAAVKTSVKGIHTKRISFALLQNSIPALHSIEIHNDGESTLENARLSISSSPSFFISKDFNLSPLTAGERYRLESIDLEYDHGLFSKLTEAEKGTLYARLIVDGQSVNEAVFPIELLARNQWSGLSEFPESIAAFVQPNDPAADRLLGQSLAIMREHHADAAFSGYGKGKKDVWRQLAAIWHTLYKQELGYILPPAGFEQQGQKVRNPSQVLDAKLGTCLDTSLLVAACLEQCQLNPLLIFTQGHAFVGCWLSPGSFSTTTIDDATALRKRIDLHEIIVFETTLLTKREQAISFQQACDSGLKNIREDVTDQFICLVDIARARIQRIKPLALAEGFQYSVRQMVLPETILDTSAGTLDFLNGAPDDLGEDIAPDIYESDTAKTRSPSDRLDRWQRKLLDLSLRNSLLNYRMGKSKRYVEIYTQNPVAVEDRLADGKRFKLLGGLDLIKGDPRADKSSPTVSAEDLLEHLASELSKKDELVTPLDQKELDSRLTTLYRAARSTLEEGGANTLYLAFGFLSWKPGGRDKPCKAPLILIPARLERRNVQSGFTLSLSDDEPRFNVTLLELLRKDYSIFALDPFGQELPTDEHGLDIDGIWLTVQHVVKDIPGWEVSRTIGLGLFSFAKYLMWKDLAEHTDILKKNAVVSHLLSPEDAFPDEPAFISPADLDVKLQPQNVYCPFLADSSQLSAIASAAKGKDFVLIGPPGTGKSQTIANMIAQCLAEEKTVLFVAEKTAALNVVHRRLKHIGLGEFCLELHSNKANKAEVIAQLSKAVETVKDSPDDWQHAALRLMQTREQLNSYVRQLHHSSPNGLSPFLAIGIVTANMSCPTIPLEWPSPEHHDRQAYEALFNTAQRIEDQGERGKALAATALKYIRREAWSPLWEQELLQSLDVLRDTTEAVHMFAQKANGACALPFENVEGDALEALLQLAERLPSAHGHLWGFALRPDAAKLIGQLKEADALLDRYATKWDTLSISYRQEVVDADINVLQEIWRMAALAWWPKSFFLKRKVKKNLQLLSNASAEPDCSSDLVVLGELQDIKRQIEALRSLADDTSGIFTGFATDRLELDAAIEFAENFRRCFGMLATTPEQFQAISTLLEHLLGAGNVLLARDGSVGRTLCDWANAVRTYRDAAGKLKVLMVTDVDFSRMSADNMLQICSEIIEQKAHINAWCSWLRVCSEAAGLGLQPLIAAVMRGALTVGKAKNALRVNYARWWVVQVIERLDGLRAFVPTEHERCITDFKELDETIRKMTCACIHRRLRGNEALAAGAPSEWRVLQRESIKKKRHMPIRRLIASMPNLLLQLTPCLLMSPLSIAQYLAAGQTTFDLVIFDEASQIPVWDAIGAMARGKKVIVVGDPKQLPPTNFFQKTDDADVDDDDLQTDDLESILEECSGAGLPSLPLRWHYRSRNESLITFSNQRYYNGDLVTFPSPDTEDRAVSLCYTGGIYQRGTSRTNPIEAKALVTDLLARLRSLEFQESKQSIGVVTFNTQQQLLIEDLLDAERRADPSLEVFFDSALEEPVLVKNLENIQGDERDIMYFSIGFGPDQAGQMTMNFGALNKDGGERRLNVAVTRARYKINVFCSLYPDQILLTQTKARGVHDLRLFLEYAQQGVKVLAAAVHSSGDDYESPFELGVAEALQKKGWQIHPQVGVSGFRIDLGIVDPDRPSKYLAGVECDGYTYHRSATARDRDHLRESVLRSLGWEILRIWSTEWWINADAAAKKLQMQLEVLLEKRRSVPNVGVLPGAPSGPALQTEFADQPLPADLSENMENNGRDIEQERLRAIVQTIVSSCSPIHENALCANVAKQLGFGRAGSKIRSGVLAVASDMYASSTEDVGVFFWDTDNSPETCTTFRKRGPKEACVVDEIAMPELVALARTIQPRFGEDPVVLMARRLGLSRLRAVTRPRLEQAWALR
jgi:very-short-patch-repair endonuclease